MRHRRSWFARFLIWLLGVLASVVVFVLLAFWILFGSMYPTGSEMLAAELLSFKVTSFIPRIYYSSADIARIRQTYTLGARGQKTADEGAAGKDAGQKEEAKLDIASTVATAAPVSGRRGESVSEVNGLAIVQHPQPTEEPAAARTEQPAPAATKAPEANTRPAAYTGEIVNPAQTYMIGRLGTGSVKNVVLRSGASLSSKSVGSVKPGTWCVVLDTKGQMAKILVDGRECYVYNDKLDVITVPLLPGVASSAEETDGADADIRAY